MAYKEGAMRWNGLAALALVGLTAPASAAPELVVDLSTGRVLHAREAQAAWHPASLTKLMTAYVALRAVAAGGIGWDSPVTLSPAALRMPPSRSGLAPGSRLALSDALRVLMVKSANDVAYAVAEAVSGDAPTFVARMNAESARLGMSATRWMNPHGLDAPAQVTTARDLAVLAGAIRREFPQADPLFSIPAVLLNGMRMPNHNKAVGRVAGIDGMKTGYICASGFNVVTTAIRDGRRVAVVLLGRDSPLERDARATLLANAALATSSPGIGSLADLAGSAGSPAPRRACGRRDGGEDADGIIPKAAMDQWVRSFAAMPVASGDPVRISTLPPGAGAAPANSFLAAVHAAGPSRSSARGPSAQGDGTVPPGAPLAYVAPTVEAISAARQSQPPRRF
jgi:D-alanyl-D-alanine carboxypeptidase